MILDFDDHEVSTEHHTTSPSLHKSCGSPDIDAKHIDMKRIHGVTNSNNTDNSHKGNISTRSIDTTGFHTFPRTSTHHVSDILYLRWCELIEAASTIDLIMICKGL